MENATKALIIAAAILIAIVLISLAVMVLGGGTQMVKDNSDMVRSISEIAVNYNYVTPVRQKALQLLKTLTGR